MWNASSHPGSEPRPLHKIARRILSICPNSASCERLFSVFGSILTKWRNRLSTENLTRIAELKLYVHEEHICANTVKQRLKRQYADEKSEPAMDLEAGTTESSEMAPSGDDMTSQGHDGASHGGDTDADQSLTWSHGIREVAESLIQAVDEEEQTLSSPASPQYNPIPIKTLLDYSESKAESWLGPFYKTAVRCLDDDLELYQLLDLDAEGINDPDHSQVEEMLVE